MVDERDPSALTHPKKLDATPDIVDMGGAYESMLPEVTVPGTRAEGGNDRRVVPSRRVQMERNHVASSEAEMMDP